MLRRVVGADGRSRAYVNGQAMPVQALRQLGETLVDVHGQMEYQSLMRRAAQRELLDQQRRARELLDAVAEQLAHWSRAARANAIAPPPPRRIAKRAWSCCAITSSELQGAGSQGRRRSKS